MRVRCTPHQRQNSLDALLMRDHTTASGGNGSDEVSVRETKTPQKREVRDAAVRDAHIGQLRDASKQTQVPWSYGTGTRTL